MIRNSQGEIACCPRCRFNAPRPMFFWRCKLICWSECLQSLVLLAPHVFAAEVLSATLEASKVVRGEDGKEQMQSAEKTRPGDVVEYRALCKNHSDKSRRFACWHHRLPDNDSARGGHDRSDRMDALWKSVAGRDRNGDIPNHDSVALTRATKPRSDRRMRYQMKQDFFSWGADFTIQDADGNDAFLVDGAGFSIGDQLSFQDLAGKELVHIEQRLFTWGPTYEIHKGDQLVAIVEKEAFTLFSCAFTVDVPGPDDLQAEGDFLDLEYEFKRGDRKVAIVSKQWFTLSDTYGIDIADGEDDVLILASAVVIDMVCHQSKND